ncbi:protein adenylyltransferase SelO [Helcobacillus massiliensis]|uniref:protein adenylyltransferase SelO n=1 Tax=Helcobacillus massiliensis TaxID=521392 RepID=UPI002553930A|nr:protein adenylyltransferase SelO family protein [Helcobacillus massiliensis]MDK7741391.1 protein adenylyltransferase SelO family protein [Helcobacillus massiliensis]WOO92762.1 protein adenylyltransferase SelO family protein [Helcobacillus massiliensis]
MDIDQDFARAFPELSVPHAALKPPQPAIARLNDELAADLGLGPEHLRSTDGIRFLTGQGPLEESDSFGPVAQAYSGHQFGQFSPLLGDGRALLLGSVPAAGRAPATAQHPSALCPARLDIHLKGSGPTPFSRGGDGRGPLGPMLREYVIGEALHHLGIPTSRALAVLRTGETVMRERPQPGGLLVRTAASHLRVGTMQLAAQSQDDGLLRRLSEWAIDAHHPSAPDRAEERGTSLHLELLRSVAIAQADLIAQWMSVGFIHGVMNTDNMTLSGQSIDFGPCAFLDDYRAGAVFSSIDHQGRYAYGNQPAIGQWNLARLGECLLPLIDEDPNAAVEAATGVLGEYADRFQQQRTRLFAAKLGLRLPGEADGDLLEPVAEFVDQTLRQMEEQGEDFTVFFRRFHRTDSQRREELQQFADRSGLDVDGSLADQVNPVVIARNGHLQRALNAAETGDQLQLEDLLRALASPFESLPGLEHLSTPGAEDGAGFRTFCGT